MTQARKRWRLGLVGLLVLAGAAPQMAVAQANAPLSGTWSPTGSMTLARAYHTATLLPDGQVLVVAGTTPFGDSISAELYNPTTGTFTPTGSLTYTREQQTATLLRDGRVLVAGGSSNQYPLSIDEIYDPATGTFTLTGSMALGRVDQTATLLRDGRVLMAGGCNGGGFGCDATWSSAELYDPRTGTFTNTGSMSVNRQYHTATLLPNGEVLVAGGCAGVNLNSCGPVPQELRSAELYNPATGTWTMTGSLPAPRMGQTATLLPNGQVLVAGGGRCITDGFCLALASAELYNPATGRWTATAPMSRPRELFTATALPDGRVLVAGGCSVIFVSGVCPYSNKTGPTASAELYTP